MNEFFPLASAAGMTVGLAVCALIIGLVLAMIFAIWESVKWRPIAWTGSAVVTILRGLPEILVVLFIYFGSSQLLLMLSDGFTINPGLCKSRCRCRLKTSTSVRSCAASSRCRCCMRHTRRKRCAAR